MPRRLLLLLLAACALALTACGDDDEEPEGALTETEPIATVPAPVTTPPPETTATDEDKEQPDPNREPRTVPPEDQQGDEEPIRSEAVFTGRGGRLTPREVRVPAFIAIRVILRSAGDDGSNYTLEIGGQRLEIGGDSDVAEANLDGLLPEKAYRGRSPQGNVRVVASAEPGP